MPAGFGFPVSSQPVGAAAAERRVVPAARPARRCRMFGKLAPGVDDQHGAGRADGHGAAHGARFPRHPPPLSTRWCKGTSHSLWSAAEDSAHAADRCSMPPTCSSSACSRCAARTSRRWCSRAPRRATPRSACAPRSARAAPALPASCSPKRWCCRRSPRSPAWRSRFTRLQWVKQTRHRAQGNRMMFWWNDALSPPDHRLRRGARGARGADHRRDPRAQGDRAQRAGSAEARDRRIRRRPEVRRRVDGRDRRRRWRVTVIFLAIVGTLGWGLYFSNAGNRRVNFPATAVRGRASHAGSRRHRDRR